MGLLLLRGRLGFVGVGVGVLDGWTVLAGVLELDVGFL